jgi:uncharacterized protein (DUF433 family)
MATAPIDVSRLLDSRDEVLNGEVVVRGTRVTVASIAVAHLSHGISLEELAEADSRLTLAALYAALAYYYSHQGEFERKHEADVAWGEERVSGQAGGLPGESARSASGG